MSLLSRSLKLALLLFVLLTLTAIPGTWSPHSSGSWLSVTPAWATSPDETLKPPSNPPRSAALYGQQSAQRGVTSVVSARTQAISIHTRFVIVWRIALASVLRF